jgi:hypothetical protein
LSRDFPGGNTNSTVLYRARATDKMLAKSNENLDFKLSCISSFANLRRVIVGRKSVLAQIFLADGVSFLLTG